MIYGVPTQANALVPEGAILLIDAANDQCLAIRRSGEQRMFASRTAALAWVWEVDHAVVLKTAQTVLRQMQQGQPADVHDVSRGREEDQLEEGGQHP